MKKVFLYLWQDQEILEQKFQNLYGYGFDSPQIIYHK